MKKYLIIIFILINYSVTFAETKENPLVNIMWDMVWWAMEMAFKIYLFFIFPILLIYFTIIYIVKKH